MAIDVRCPHCKKAYRVKDEMGGKSVRCPVEACRKTFQVPAAGANGTTTVASTNGSTPTRPAARPKPAVPPVDYEALAAAALNDDPPPVPVEQRVVKMKCTVCEHLWDVGWDMQGKNVLCPDCKHRQKVPTQKDAKKADWRTGGGRPSMAKVEELEGVQASTNQSYVSGSTLRETGIVKTEYEDRPTSFYVKIAAGVLGLLLAVGGTWFFLSKSRRDTVTAVKFDDILTAGEDDLKALPPPADKLGRAVLRIAAAEYEAKLNDEKARDKALDHIRFALDELKAAPRSADRDALLGELAVVCLNLGSADADALRDKKKLTWLPMDPNKATRAQVKPNPAELLGVHGQLQRVFQAMNDADKRADLDARLAAARRVARELAKLGQVDLAESFAQPGFGGGESAEASGQIGLEFARAGNMDAATRIAAGLAAAVANPTSAGQAPSAVALLRATGSQAPALPPGSDAARFADVAQKASAKDDAGAVAASKQSGSPEGRVRALALAAEWADQPQAAVDEAAKAVTNAKSAGGVPGPAAAVLTREAGRAGLTDKVEEFGKAIADEALRAWAKGDAVRARLAADRGAAIDDAAAEMPDDPKKVRAGHLWGRLWMARAGKPTTGWPAPFSHAGKAGAALAGQGG